MVWLLAFMIGFFAGLRSLMPPAAVAWAAYLGRLNLDGPLAFMGSVYSVAILTVLALGELGADKWAKIPDRISLQPLIARVLTGGLAGACVAVGASESLLPGAVLGGVGGIVGAFAGYHARKRLVQTLKVPDFSIAILEDLVAIGGCVWVMSRFV